MQLSLVIAYYLLIFSLSATGQGFRSRFLTNFGNHTHYTKDIFQLSDETYRGIGMVGTYTDRLRYQVVISSISHAGAVNWSKIMGDPGLEHINGQALQSSILLNSQIIYAGAVRSSDFQWEYSTLVSVDMHGNLTRSIFCYLFKQEVRC
jgi:hypothetical protein